MKFPIDVCKISCQSAYPDNAVNPSINFQMFSFSQFSISLLLLFLTLEQSTFGLGEDGKSGFHVCVSYWGYLKAGEVNLNMYGGELCEQKSELSTMSFFYLLFLKQVRFFCKVIGNYLNVTDIESIFICSFWMWPDFHKCKALTDAVFYTGLWGCGTFWEPSHLLLLLKLASQGIQVYRKWFT